MNDTIPTRDLIDALLAHLEGSHADEIEWGIADRDYRLHFDSAEGRSQILATIYDTTGEDDVEAARVVVTIYPLPGRTIAASLEREDAFFRANPQVEATS